MFVWGAAIALFISFIALGALWKRPRLAVLASGRTFHLSRRTTSSLAWLGRIVVLALFLVTMLSGLFGTTDDDLGIVPVAFYVVAWVGAQVLSGVFGNVWQVVNPVVTIARSVEWARDRISRGPRPSDQVTDRPTPPAWMGM